MPTITSIRASLVCAAVFLAVACSGKDGAQGPTGPQGAVGPQGVAGNANVVIYTYGSATFTGSVNYTLNISQGMIDSSLVLAYYNPSTEAATAWYPVPGLGSGGMYDTRYILYQTSTSPSVYTLGVRLIQPGSTSSYNTPVTFTKFRIVIAKASSIVPGAQRVQPDWSNYSQAQQYLGLPE